MDDNASQPSVDPAPHSGRTLQLWMVPAFGLVSAPLAFLLGLSSRGILSLRLLELFFVLGVLSPVLGLVTLAVLLEQYLTVPERLLDVRRRRRAKRLAILATISPVWLSVMYFAFAVFHR
jgi:hypothetical protein